MSSYRYADCFDRHTLPRTLACYKYHGQQKNIPLLELLKYDVVLTTYGTLATGSTQHNSMLQQIDWYRIILDEGKCLAWFRKRTKLTKVTSSCHPQRVYKAISGGMLPSLLNQMVSDRHTNPKQTGRSRIPGQISAPSCP